MHRDNDNVGGDEDHVEQLANTCEIVGVIDGVRGIAEAVPSDKIAGGHPLFGHATLVEGIFRAATRSPTHPHVIAN